jgi:flagellar biosynthesis protein FlhF
MIHRLLVNFTGDVFENRELIQSKVREMLEAMIPRREPIRKVDGQATIVAFVGPSGMGKTTTVAKVAAEALLLRGQRVVAVATDDRRIAALDQMRAYASIINFPVDVVYTPEEMRDVIRLRRQETFDLILIDTTGANPHDEEEMKKLKEILDFASPTETHLVISASTGLETILDTVEAFRPLSIGHLLFTKLDETHRSGVILSAFMKTGLPASYFTTGRNVPGDIAVADPAVFIQTFWK